MEVFGVDDLDEGRRFGDDARLLGLRVRVPMTCELLVVHGRLRQSPRDHRNRGDILETGGDEQQKRINPEDCTLVGEGKLQQRVWSAAILNLLDSDRMQRYSSAISLHN